jgi:hypothetical protein
MSSKASLSACRPNHRTVNSITVRCVVPSLRRVALLLLVGCGALLSACRTAPQSTGPWPAPYAHSRAIPAVRWEFDRLQEQRRAHGSDLWPCAWAHDDQLYCAWGDGGGFDGDSDSVGRVSLGFARISGSPGAALHGANLWGSPPYAEAAATFGGKVGSMAAADDVLFAVGSFWRPEDTADAVHKSGHGPHHSLAWSQDQGHSWTLARWGSDEPVGAFLDRGREPVGPRNEYLYLYYFRSHDDRRLYLKRVRAQDLRAEGKAPAFEYYAGPAGLMRWARWSSLESAAAAVFSDPHHVEGPCVVYVKTLNKYLLTAGHYMGENDEDSSAGQVGLFESSHAWGPWRTIGYYENWGGLHEETRGDYLGLRPLSKWFSNDGTDLWAVFSGLHSFDSFNVVRGRLEVQGRRPD